MLYAEHMLSFWESGLWVPDGQRVTHGQSSVKALCLECVSLGVRSSHALSQHTAGGIQGVPCGSTGEGTLEAAAGFPDFTPRTFCLCRPCLGSFSVINHIHEYECGWSPSVLLRNLGVALGTPGSALHHLVHHLVSSPVTLPPRLSPDSPTLAVPSVWRAPYSQPRGPFPHLVQGSFPVSPIRKAMLDHPV